MSVGGSIEEISFEGRAFSIAGDADSSRDIGGFTVEVESNGNGTARKIKTRKPWKVDGLMADVNDENGDHEFMQNLADSNGFVAFTVTYASGDVYQGLGTITGDIEFSSQKATATITASGPAKLVKQ